MYRLYSTATVSVSPKRTLRVPLARLGDILIPSREEVRAKVAAAAAPKPSYAPDISYLDNASDNFLAAELARIETTDDGPVHNVRMHISSKSPRRPPPTAEEIAALAAKRRDDRIARTSGKSPPLVPQEIAAQTIKRRAERIARSPDKPPSLMPQEIAILTAKRREDRLARTPDQSPPLKSQEIAALTAKRREERISRATDYIPVKSQSEFERMDAFKSSDGNAQAPLQSRDRPLYRRPPQPVRFDQRPSQQQYPSSGFSKRPRTRQSGPRPPVRRPTRDTTPSTYDHGIDESVFQPGGHLPQFSGPELPSSNLLESFGPTLGTKDFTVVAQSGTSFKTSLSKVYSFYKGDYTRYVGTSSERYSSSPDALGAVKLAERTLAHQRQYNLSERQRMLELVAQASQPAANLPSTR